MLRCCMDKGFPSSETEARNWILAHTRVASPGLCPEIRMRLITPEMDLWRADQQTLDSLGIDDPFWAFCWPGGQALARYLLDHPAVVADKRVYVFGAGGGVEAIAAALAGAAQVTAVDIDPLAAEAVRLNSELNRVQVQTVCRDEIGKQLDDWDLVTAADVTYEADLAARVLPWLEAQAAAGRLVLLADPHRGHIPTGIDQAIWQTSAPADTDVDGRFMVLTSVYSL